MYLGFLKINSIVYEILRAPRESNSAPLQSLAPELHISSTCQTEGEEWGFSDDF